MAIINPLILFPFISFRVSLEWAVPCSLYNNNYITFTFTDCQAAALMKVILYSFILEAFISDRLQQHFKR